MCILWLIRCLKGLRHMTHWNFGFTPHSYFKCLATLPLCLYLRPHPFGQWMSSSPSTQRSPIIVQQTKPTSISHTFKLTERTTSNNNKIKLPYRYSNAENKALFYIMFEQHRLYVRYTSISLKKKFFFFIYIHTLPTYVFYIENN